MWCVYLITIVLILPYTPVRPCHSSSPTFSNIQKQNIHMHDCILCVPAQACVDEHYRVLVCFVHWQLDRHSWLQLFVLSLHSCKRWGFPTCHCTSHIWPIEQCGIFLLCQLWKFEEWKWNQPLRENGFVSCCYNFLPGNLDINVTRFVIRFGHTILMKTGTCFIYCYWEFRLFSL